jgi:hypothetical protein
MWTLAMASKVQISTTSHHQDLDKLSHVLYVRQFHRSSPQHQDGCILTERLVPHGKLYKQGASSPELTSMIQCRNFLRVSRMSEIATGCGSRILPRIYNGEEPESDTTNKYPIQPRQPKWAWAI